MTSKKQIEANRKNAKRSTGPKSAIGKTGSRMNACKHGLTAETIVIADEDPAEFDSLRAAFTEEFAPRSAVEGELVERLAGIAWRLRRVPRFEAGLIEARGAETAKTDSQDFDLGRRWRAEMAERYRLAGDANRPRPQYLKDLTEELDERDRAEAEAKAQQTISGGQFGLALIRDAQQNDTLGKLSRHEAALMSGYARTLHLLLFLKDRDAGNKTVEMVTED